MHNRTLPLPAERVSSACSGGSGGDSQSVAVSEATRVGSVTDKASGSSDGLKGAVVSKTGEDAQPGAGVVSTEKRIVSPDGRVLLTEPEAYESLGFSFPTAKKWGILTVIFVVQVSMNLNASLYANAVPLLSDHFHISEQVCLALP